MNESIGFFRVNQVRWLGANIQYLLVFRRDELVGVKVGGQFADDINKKNLLTVALGSGVLGAAAANAIVQPADRSGEFDSISRQSSEELLHRDKRNFRIPYSSIQSVELKQSNVGVNGPRAGTIKIMAQGNPTRSFDLAPEQQFEQIDPIVRKALKEKAGP